MALLEKALSEKRNSPPTASSSAVRNGERKDYRLVRGVKAKKQLDRRKEIELKLKQVNRSIKELSKSLGD
ncbi:MAG: hypothetical protein V3V57_00455 [Spirochaetia bacterium]